jgi:hypothetical protein
MIAGEVDSMAPLLVPIHSTQRTCVCPLPLRILVRKLRNEDWPSPAARHVDSTNEAVKASRKQDDAISIAQHALTSWWRATSRLKAQSPEISCKDAEHGFNSTLLSGPRGGIM